MKHKLDVKNMSQGNQMIIDKVVYKVTNFDFKDNYKLQTFVALKKV